MLGSEILTGTKRMDMVWSHVCLVVIFLKPAAGHVGFADIGDAFCFVSFIE